MTKEYGSTSIQDKTNSTSEQRKQIENSVQFLNLLYDKTVAWLMMQEGEVKQHEFKPQEIENWLEDYDYHRGATRLGLKLERGCLVVDSKKISLITLGLGALSGLSPASLRFQFAFSPLRGNASDFVIEENISKYKGWFDAGWGHGEFFARNSGNAKVETSPSTWVGRFPFQGPDFNRLSEEEILSPQGLEVALKIIEITAFERISRYER